MGHSYLYMAKDKKQKPKARKPKRIKKDCYFVESGTTPDYKDVLILRRFISERGKIIPRAYSGVNAKNQRLLAKEIKKARFMALIPYTDRHAL